MEWLQAHWSQLGLVVSVLMAVVAAVKAKDWKKVATTVIAGVEQFRDDNKSHPMQVELKNTIRSTAIDAGADSLLHAAVKKITAGLVVLFLVGISAVGCAAPAAGQATTPVTATMITSELTLPALPEKGAAGAGASYVVTIQQTVTITPTSTATQSASATADIKPTVTPK